MENIINQLMLFATDYGIKIIGAIVILILGRIAAGFGRNIIGKILVKAKTDAAVVSFTKNLTYIFILIFAVLAALSKFGIQTTSVVAVLGASAFAVGLALQGSLGDFAAGVLLLVLRPFNVNDYVDVAGVAGTVKEIQLFTSILTTPDNVKILVPNGKIFGNIIKNFSAMDTRRVDLEVGIGYGSSIEKAMAVAREVVSKDSRVLPEPAVQIAVSALADSSVNLVIRPWVKSADYWGVKFDLNRNIKEAFDQNGVEIPFPQRVVHMVGQSE